MATPSSRRTVTIIDEILNIPTFQPKFSFCGFLFVSLHAFFFSFDKMRLAKEKQKTI